MAKNRVIFLLWLFAAGLLHIFGNEFGTRVILYASVIIPFVLVFISWLAARRMGFLFDIPALLIFGETAELSVTLTGGGFLPGYVKCKIICENLLTGQRLTERLIISPSENGVSLPVYTKHCGMLSFSVSQPLAFDLFGLFAWRIKCETQANLLIMPERMDINLQIDPDTRTAADSEEYSMRRPGNDPSETFAIREYIPGDPLKSIHWKLSNKTDKLLVRELGLPIVTRILIIMETSAQGEVFEPSFVNKMASALYSVSHELVLRGVSQTIVWLDTAAVKLRSGEITSLAEGDGVFAELLANTVKDCETTTIDAYSAIPAESVYSHVIICGLSVPSGVNQIFGQSAVTVLDCSGDDFNVLEL